MIGSHFVSGARIFPRNCKGDLARYPQSRMTRDGSQVEKNRNSLKKKKKEERSWRRTEREGRIERRSSLLDAGQLTNRGKT